MGRERKERNRERKKKRRETVDGRKRERKIVERESERGINKKKLRGKSVDLLHPTGVY